jgi:uncharacterized protein YndB with AHSA1/START domain
MTAQASTAAQTSLVLKRVFSVPREKVFEAWNNPEMLKQWLAPAGYSTPEAEVDLRVGGRYRVVMRHDEKGAVHTAVGEYREITSPERLVFTWMWEEGDQHEMLITIDFREEGGSTEMIFKHERFASTEDRTNHEQGWTSSFEKLSALISA